MFVIELVVIRGVALHLDDHELLYEWLENIIATAVAERRDQRVRF
jgi:hypothetical protein